jgi:hypothetical protein
MDNSMPNLFPNAGEVNFHDDLVVSEVSEALIEVRESDPEKVPDVAFVLDEVRTGNASTREPDPVIPDPPKRIDPFTNKYKELEMLTEVLAHIKKTYGQYYVDPKSDVQVFDLMANLNYDGVPNLREYSRGAAIKYLCRYGKKNGYNREDIRKAVHYCLMLMYSTLPEEQQ